MLTKGFGGSAAMNGERAGMQRRLAAILFADVVGYSGIVAADETSALAGLRWLRRIIKPQLIAHDGRSFAALGDGFAAEFPSAVRAVACAVSIQRVLAAGQAAPGSSQSQKLTLRIGINLGDVVVEPNGDLLGDGVNVAARLEALAKPGGIAISGNTFDEMRGRLPYPFEDAGEHVLKNIPWRVRVFTLSAAAINALPAAELETRRSAPRRSGRIALAVGFGLFAAALLAGVFVWYTPALRPSAPLLAVGAPPTGPTSAPGEPRQASLVVLPLANLRGDPEQD
jgi:adenylate cyclase